MRSLLCVLFLEGGPFSDLFTEAANLLDSVRGHARCLAVLETAEQSDCGNAAVCAVMGADSLPSGLFWTWGSCGDLGEGIGIARRKRDRVRAVKLAVALARCSEPWSEQWSWLPPSFRSLVDQVCGQQPLDALPLQEIAGASARRE